MRGQSETTINVEWKTNNHEAQGKKALEQEWLRYEGLERRDTYRFNLSNTYPMKMIMIINDLIIKKGVIRDLSAGGFSCDLFETIVLPVGQKTNIRFKLNMDEPVIIKSEATYQGSKGSGYDSSRIYRFEFADNMSEGERDSIHQYILIKQLEVFRSNRRKTQDD